MKKFLPLIIAFFAATAAALAQNNSYQLDDECFEAYRQTELKAGTPEFAAANDLLMKTAIEKGDTKAQTL